MIRVINILQGFQGENIRDKSVVFNPNDVALTIAQAVALNRELTFTTGVDL